MRTSPGNRGCGMVVSLCCAYVLVPTVSLNADAQSNLENGNWSSAPTNMDTFEEPRTKLASLDGFYPLNEIQTNGEGWVNLSMMVDSKGKPYEIAVTESTGNKVFERAAIAAVSRFVYQPGSVNGQPIDSSVQLALRFSLPDIERGVNRAFNSSYQTALAAIKANDPAAADAAIKRLEIRNLTEDAYFGLLKYYYAQRWGDELEQLTGLRRATATDQSRDYLRHGAYGDALHECLVLELKVHDYAAALKTWDRLQKLHRDGDATMQAAIASVGGLRNDDRSYDVYGVIANQPWHLMLFKRHFRIAVKDGYIAQVKLLCKKRYAGFTFDLKSQYTADEDWGDCLVRLEGTPGTHFTLSQS